MTESARPADFPTTRWSRVARAGDPADARARAALAELCSAYWYPIYAFIRRQGHGESEALDLTQEYFARLLEKPVSPPPTRCGAASAAFLRADCGFFLADRRDRDQAQKRGGTVRRVDRRPRRRGPIPRRTGRRADPRAALRPRLGPDPARPRPRPAGRRLRRHRPRRVVRAAPRRARLAGSRTVAYAEIGARARPDRGGRPAGGSAGCASATARLSATRSPPRSTTRRTPRSTSEIRDLFDALGR